MDYEGACPTANQSFESICTSSRRLRRLCTPEAPLVKFEKSSQHSREEVSSPKMNETHPLPRWSRRTRVSEAFKKEMLLYRNVFHQFSPSASLGFCSTFRDTRVPTHERIRRALRKRVPHSIFRTARRSKLNPWMVKPSSEVKYSDCRQSSASAMFYYSRLEQRKYVDVSLTTVWMRVRFAQAFSFDNDALCGSTPRSRETRQRRLVRRFSAKRSDYDPVIPIKSSITDRGQ